MKKNYKNFSFLIFFLIFFIFPLNEFCLARVLEVEYPPLPSGDIITTTTVLPEYLKYLFNFGVLLGFLAAFISLIIGGFLYIISPISPEKQKDAKNRIIAGVLGMILLLATYLIITTINPQLSIFEVSNLQDVPGIYLLGGGKKWPCGLTGTSDTNRIDPIPNQIEYSCFKTDDPPLVITFYSNPNFTGTISKAELECGNTTPVTGQSFNFQFSKTGVSLYTKDNCPVESDEVSFTWSLPKLLSKYENKVKSIKIANNPSQYIYYGATVHSERNFRGRCLQIPSLLNSVGCSNNCATPVCGYNISDYNPSSITIYRFYADPASTGKVTFYRKPSYNSQGGSFEITNHDILYYSGQYRGYYWNSLTNLKFNNVPIEEQDCAVWNLDGTCPVNKRVPPTLANGNVSSIKIEGNYLVFLYDISREDICQLFPTPTDVNKEGPKQLKWEYISRDGRLADYVYIIPIKDLKFAF